MSLQVGDTVPIIKDKMYDYYDINNNLIGGIPLFRERKVKSIHGEMF